MMFKGFRRLKSALSSILKKTKNVTVLAVKDKNMMVDLMFCQVAYLTLEMRSQSTGLLAKICLF